MQYAIEVQDLWKKYRLYHDRTATLKERLLFRGRNRYDDLWALQGVSLQVPMGKTLGLIGQNGSGKSTLLKLMSRIIYPDRGSVCVHGKVSSLLELGAGFHPDFTGLENIYMNAAIFGMNRHEIERKLQAIIDFSELGDFIYSPVRTYSSGMYMRLAFAVAINVDPDILLIDEILAVGDQNYQIKCFEKLREIKGAGKTIVIVSHDLNSLERLCTDVVWLHEGLIQAAGSPAQVIDSYHEHNLQERAAVAAPPPEQAPAAEDSTAEKLRWGTREIELADLRLIDSASGQEVSVLQYGQAVEFHITYRCSQPVNQPLFGLAIHSSDGVYCYGTNTMIDRLETGQVSGTVEVKFIIEDMCLVQGTYIVDVAAAAEDYDYDYVRKACSFQVVSPLLDLGIYRPRHHWDIRCRD